MFLTRAGRSATKIAVFMRHAAKDAEGNITQEGREKAIAFGAHLPSGFSLRIVHSSANRCKETAECIQMGFMSEYSDSKILGVDTKLDTMYYFCNDHEKMKIYKQHYGGTAFLHDWIKGRLPQGLMQPAKEAVTEMVQHFSKELHASENHTILLFIGHDFGIILVRDILFNTDFRKKDVPWIQPLDGILFSESDTRFTASWTNNSIVVSRSVYGDIENLLD